MGVGHAGQVMTDLHITSPANPRLKELLGLRRRRTREQTGTTVLEGTEELRLAIEAGVTPFAVYHCPELMHEAGPQAVDAARAVGAEVISLSREAFAKVSYREGPDGVLATVPAPGRPWDEIELPAHPFVLVVEGVEKPGNLGAMLRTADAVGADLVIAADCVTDWGNPNVIRSSKGTVFAVPVVSGTREQAWTWLAERGVMVVATTPDTDRLHTDVDYRSGVAVAVGSEKYGLTQEALAGAAERVRIPMVGRVNSLNVATSAAVVLYEAVRQRSAQR
ncbi:TrmH family RNA methyltransferase [Marihabitans asiaticum]|uniref:TrmH family RNA methyltransferase n=2 Tax=Marihabitans asiaticum TaxID=415218 RepID=A0A560WE69_9MICO|nr:TrmH family RNA methyltransferase [Marihabitans asiaticum]